MAHETVPADIAAAIEAFDRAAQVWGWEADMGTGGQDTAEAMSGHGAARAALDAAILSTSATPTRKRPRWSGSSRGYDERMV